MNFNSIEDWRAYARTLPAVLSKLDRTGSDGGLNLAALVLWRSISAAPTSVANDFEHISEAVIRNEARAVSGNIDDRSFGLKIPRRASDEAIVLKIAGCLRAIETELSHLDEGSRPNDPNDDWYVEYDGEGFFLIPVIPLIWKKPKPYVDDFRPFSQRGLLHMRIVPAVIDGIKVKLYRPDRLRLSQSPASFGALLFKKVDFDEQTTKKTFLIKGVKIPDLDEHLLTACTQMHQNGCVAGVMPELTISNTSQQFISNALAEKPWLAVGPTTLNTPAIVVAGSWHTPVGRSKFANISNILDGDGETLLQYHKRRPYRAPDGRTERIVKGNEIPILVLDDGIFGFAICLDFCHRGLASPYGLLHLDFILVPSCGNDNTMSGHIRTAADMADTFKARTFVVQQAYPPLAAPGCGYVLPPGISPMTKTPKDLVIDEIWTDFPLG